MITHLMASTEFLAQLDQNITPQAPAGSNGIIMLLRIGMWFVLISGVAGVMYGGGRFAWEKFNGGAIESPKIIAGSLIGGVFAVSASGLMNMVITATQQS
ncbi:hypothetical protein ACWELJ_21385 [Nocardia sp. NPDC004582]